MSEAQERERVIQAAVLDDEGVPTGEVKLDGLGPHTELYGRRLRANISQLAAADLLGINNLKLRRLEMSEQPVPPEILQRARDTYPGP